MTITDAIVYLDSDWQSLTIFQWVWVGVAKPNSPVPLFSSVSSIVNTKLPTEYHVYIWRVAPQLSCGDTYQIWMWLEEYNRKFFKITYFAYGEINQRNFSDPYPCQTTIGNWIVLT